MIYTWPCRLVFEKSLCLTLYFSAHETNAIGPFRSHAKKWIWSLTSNHTCTRMWNGSGGHKHSKPTSLANALQPLKKCLWGHLQFSVVGAMDTSPGAGNVSNGRGFIHYICLFYFYILMTHWVYLGLFHEHGCGCLLGQGQLTSGPTIRVIGFHSPNSH